MPKRLGLSTIKEFARMTEPTLENPGALSRLVVEIEAGAANR
jgi:hypothetical protein